MVEVRGAGVESLPELGLLNPSAVAQRSQCHRELVPGHLAASGQGSRVADIVISRLWTLDPSIRSV